MILGLKIKSHRRTVSKSDYYKSKNFSKNILSNFTNNIDYKTLKVVRNGDSIKKKLNIVFLHQQNQLIRIVCVRRCGNLLISRA